MSNHSRTPHHDCPVWAIARDHGRDYLPPEDIGDYDEPMDCKPGATLNCGGAHNSECNARLRSALGDVLAIMGARNG